MQKVMLCAVCAVSALLASPGRGAEPDIYWTGDGAVHLTRIGGTGSQDVVAGLVNASALDFDEVEGKIYWVDSLTPKIQRANADGSNVEDLVTTGVIVPRGLDVDESGRKLYWTHRTSSGSIMRSDLDGSNVVTILRTNRPQGIQVDHLSAKIYWSEDIPGRIRRANLDGTGVQTLVSGGDPEDIALDLVNGKIYWTENAYKRIQRANLDGSNIENLVTVGLTVPFGIDVDPIGEKVYWSDNGALKVQRADLSGANVEDLVSGVTQVNWVALGPHGQEFLIFEPQNVSVEFGEYGSDAVSFSAELELNESSDGIFPKHEDVSISFGTYTETIPAGAFVCAAFECSYKSQGPGITSAVITNTSLSFSATSVDLTDTKNPVEVEVVIGNDSGAASVRLHGSLRLGGTPLVLTPMSPAIRK